jgi:hypothetical protein
MLVPHSRRFGTKSGPAMEVKVSRQQVRVMRMLKLKVQSQRAEPLRRRVLDSAELQPRLEALVVGLNSQPRRRGRLRRLRLLSRLRPRSKLRLRPKMMLTEKVILRESLLMMEI